jgi:hypothetical protein
VRKFERRCGTSQRHSFCQVSVVGYYRYSVVADEMLCRDESGVSSGYLHSDLSKAAPMSDAKGVLEQAIELWNAGDRDGWAELYEENVEWEAPGGRESPGWPISR